MSDVTENENGLAGEVAPFLMQGEAVEQRLRGMCMPPVTRVDDRAVETVGKKPGRTGMTMADDDGSGAMACKVSAVSLSVSPW